MKERKIPMRRCIGCMQSREKAALVRIACYEGQITVDPTGRAKGRGVYLCRDNRDCWKQAEKKKAIERNFHVPVSEEVKEALLAGLEAILDGE